EGLEHRLANGDKEQLFGLAVRWFRTGNRRLCEALAQIISASRNAVPFDGTLKSFGLTGSQQVVICHKAIAYLFLHSAVAASIVVAALRAGDKTVERDLEDLLVYPILINFRGAVLNYLRSIPKGDTAYAAVRKALKRGDGYFRGAQIKTPIKELAPSAYQRNIVRMKQYEMGRQIHKEVEKRSVLLSLVHRSTLLYGRKSLTYVGGADKPPVAMDLKPMSHSMEMPQLDTIDPVGLDYLLRIFRLSKPK